MIEYNKETGEGHVFCDHCGVEILDNVYSLDTGESLCHTCFEEHYKVLPVQEYIDDVTK